MEEQTDMNSSTVKDILIRHYGIPRSSLVIGSPGAADSDSKMIFCTLTKDTEDRAFGIVNDIAPNHLAAFTQKLGARDGIDDGIPECVFFDTKANNVWEASFYRCKSIDYRPARGRKMTASLRLTRYPTVKLTSRKPLFGLCEDKGFTYWANKELRQNRRFNSVVTDLLKQVGDAENPFMIKIAEAISRHECFLPTLSADALNNCKNPKDLIDKLSLSSVPEADYDSIDLNTGFMISYLSNFVEPEDWPILAETEPYIVSHSLDLGILFERNPKPFLCTILSNRCMESENFELLDIVEEYVDLSLKDGQKIRLDIDQGSILKSYEKLAQKAGVPYVRIHPKSLISSDDDGTSGAFELVSPTEDIPF